MKRLVGIFVFLTCAGLSLWGQTSWKGQAEVWSDSSLPVDGFFVASDQFPRNTVLDVENYKTRKSVQVRVVASLPTGSACLVKLSPKAATALGMAPGDSVPVSIQIDTSLEGYLASGSDQSWRNISPPVAHPILVNPLMPLKVASSTAPPLSSPAVAAPAVAPEPASLPPPVVAPAPLPTEPGLPIKSATPDEVRTLVPPAPESAPVPVTLAPPTPIPVVSNPPVAIAPSKVQPVTPSVASTAVVQPVSLGVAPPIVTPSKPSLANESPAESLTPPPADAVINATSVSPPPAAISSPSVPSLALVPPLPTSTSWVPQASRLQGPILGNVKRVTSLHGQPYVRLAAFSEEKSLLVALSSIRSFVPLTVITGGKGKEAYILTAVADRNQLGVLLLLFRDQGYRTAYVVKG